MNNRYLPDVNMIDTITQASDELMAIFGNQFIVPCQTADVCPSV